MAFSASTRVNPSRRPVIRNVWPAILQDRFNHLRDDVAGAMDDHAVAHTQVAAPQILKVVQGGALHDDAADGDGVEPRVGYDSARAPHVEHDLMQTGGGLEGR